jgi:predicted nucleic acid-binding protein
MRRVLLDTNVYIAFMNHREHEDIVLGSGMVRHMSTVVWMELQAGATTKRAEQAVARIARTFAATGRLIAPSVAVWKSAGPVLRRLRTSGRETRRASLVHDVLIALTARDLGATVVTSDASDFGAIQKHVDFSWMDASRTT